MKINRRQMKPAASTRHSAHHGMRHNAPRAARIRLAPFSAAAPRSCCALACAPAARAARLTHQRRASATVTHAYQRSRQRSIARQATRRRASTSRIASRYQRARGGIAPRGIAASRRRYLFAGRTQQTRQALTLLAPARARRRAPGGRRSRQRGCQQSRTLRRWRASRAFAHSARTRVCAGLAAGALAPRARIARALMAIKASNKAKQRKAA